MPPETRYARSGDVGIAYQELGEGELDIVVAYPYLSHLDLMWENPALVQFLRRLGSFARVITFDRRGVGLSDPVDGTTTLEERMDDLRGDGRGRVRARGVVRHVGGGDDLDAVRRHAPGARLGDRRWRDLLERHQETTRAELGRFQGREVKTTGDGFLAIFDGPTRAAECARAIAAAMPALGIEVRAGLHTGEVELMGEDVGGIAVHVAARIAALAGAGEVLVSRTVRDLSAGSGVEFAAAGRHALKGVPEEWELYRVA